MVSIVTGYHPHQLASGEVEYFNTDHQHYFLVNSLSHLASRLDMTVLNCDYLAHKGGSLHFLMGQLPNRDVNSFNVDSLLEAETALGFTYARGLLSLGILINESRQRIKETFRLIDPDQVVTLGASIGAITRMYLTESNSFVSLLADQDTFKQGLFIPSHGGQVHVLDSPEVLSRPFALSLIPRFTETVIRHLRSLGWTGKVIP